MPVIRNDHQAQFFATPDSLTNPVTRFGVSAEKVVATIETPRSHQGMDLPARKYSTLLLPAVLDAINPIIRTMKKKAPYIY